MKLIQVLAVKFVKAKWGSILPAMLKAVAEGGLGETPKRLYWALAGKKTALGAALIFAAYGLEAICNAYPEMQWGCRWSQWVLVIGGVLASVGLADGGTRAPWPTGTPIPPEVKKG